LFLWTTVLNMSADGEDIFDMTHVKKKKKKTGFDLDAVLAEGDSSTVPAEPAEAVPTEDSLVDDLDSMMLSKKKKKKKLVAFDEEANKENAEEAPKADDDTDFDFASMKKKKKGKSKKGNFDIDKIIGEEENEEGAQDGQAVDSWAVSEADYPYDEILKRAFDILRVKNPEMYTGEKKKFSMKPPLVQRVGSKKTAFVNFEYYCKLFHRPPKHVLDFLFAELGASGSVDSSNQLIIKGKFMQKQIENVIRRYIKEYVTCHTCRSSETILQKEDRLHFLQCEKCNSRCSVAQIKTGFQAVANKQQRQALKEGK